MHQTSHLPASLVVIFALAFSPGNDSMADEPPAENSSRLTVDHYFKLGAVSDPQISPEGDWIAYTVKRANLEDDKSRSRVWMIPDRGGDPVALTADGESSSHPRWSPDGRYLAFLSARNEGKTQVWSLYRGGGEAIQLTDSAQSVQSFE
jgi:dipeptidyl aminopeptidase/acylaminoacyl peptidase